MNPVDDRAFTGPLISALRQHVDAATESMVDGGTRAGYLDELARARPAAVAWVVSTVLVAWAEDHHLIDPWLREDARTRRKEFLDLPGMTMTAWVARAIASLCVHPSTWCLLDPKYTQLRDHTPAETVVRDLVEWWSTDAPSFAYPADEGPTSITGWLPGDLLQALSDERRKGLAFAQTPWWIADGILDLTLVPAANEFRDEPLRVVDPCCGTGHFLTRQIDYLWELYTTGSVACRQMRSDTRADGWTPVPPIEAVRRILAGCHGCDRDPLITAVARLRYTVTLGDLMHRAGLIDELRLDRIPRFQVPVVVGDSLLAGVIPKQAYAELHPDLASIVNLGRDEQSAQGALFGEAS